MKGRRTRKTIYSLSHSVASELWMFVHWAGAADEWESKQGWHRGKASTYIPSSCMKKEFMLSMKKGEVHLFR